MGTAQARSGGLTRVLSIGQTPYSEQAPIGVECGRQG